jgi:hypothetical protein
MTKTDELAKRQKPFFLKIIFAFGISGLSGLGASPQPVESLPSRASESNDKVVRLECRHAEYPKNKTALRPGGVAGFV